MTARRLTEYEQAVTFCAAVYPMVWVWGDGSYTVHVSESVKSLPVMVFYPHFAEIINNGLMDLAEHYPAEGYFPNNTCREKAFELWRACGHEPYYPEPGVVWAK